MGLGIDPSISNLGWAIALMRGVQSSYNFNPLILGGPATISIRCSLPPSNKGE